MKKLFVLSVVSLFCDYIYPQKNIVNDPFWYRHGPHCAHITALAMAPSNPNVIYIGTFSTGLYKTGNSGETWEFCSTENLPAYEDSLYFSPSQPGWWFGDYYPVNAIAVNPVNENNVWVGTFQNGLLVSYDGGNNWQKAHSSLPDTLKVSIIDINPNNPQDILLGAGIIATAGYPRNGGVYRTIDGGGTWQFIEVVPNDETYFITSIARNPVNQQHIIVGLSGGSDPDFAWGIYETFDDGNTWQEVMNTFPVLDISINPLNTQNLWGIVGTGWLQILLMHSFDGGQTWSLYEGFDNPFRFVLSLYADNDFNLYIERESEDPEYSITHHTIMKSSDFGASWIEIDKLTNKFSGGTIGGSAVGLRNRTQASPGNSDIIHFGNYFGNYYSTDGGINTTIRNKNLMNSHINGLAVHPYNQDIVYATSRQGLWKSTDAGLNWETINSEGSGSYVFDPLFPDTMYYGARNPMRSFDGGITYENIRGIVIGAIWGIAIHPVVTNIIYLHASTDTYAHRLYKSTNYGENWELIHVSGNYEDYTKIIIDRVNPDTVYFGRHRSIDAGLTWQENVLPYKIIGVHPYNNHIVYGSQQSPGNDVRVSYDWGNTFHLLDEQLDGLFPSINVRNFKINSDNPDYLYYCTGKQGIRYSNDAGSSWQWLDGSYNKRTTDIIPLPGQNRYYIATHGDGVWVYDTTYTSTTPILNKQNYNVDLRVSPNPFNEFIKIGYTVRSAGEVSIVVFDTYGRHIKTLINDFKNTEEYEIIWNGRGKNGKEVNPGLYIVRLFSGWNIHTQKVLYLK